MENSLSFEDLTPTGTRILGERKQDSNTLTLFYMCVCVLSKTKFCDQMFSEKYQTWKNILQVPMDLE